MKIGVFDSGIGGLTVLDELVKKFPNNEYIYLADMLNSPFGDKTEDQIRDISKKILEFMKSKEVNMVVCACGTISGVSREILKIFSIDNNLPVFEMTAGIKQALMKNNKKNILLLATAATIKKGVFEKNIKYLDEVEIIAEACPEFVKLLESDIRDEEVINQEVENHLKKINSDVDSIVLGCTHYGLVKDNIKKYEPKVDIFESGKCLVDRKDVRDILENSIDSEKIINIFTTKVTKKIDDMSKDIFDVNSKLVEI